MAAYEELFTSTKPRRPWMRWLKRISCGLLILLIPVMTLLILGVCFGVWRHHTIQQRLDKALAELDRTDPGWRLEDIEAAREQIPENENMPESLLRPAPCSRRTGRLKRLSNSGIICSRKNNSPPTISSA